MTLGGSSYQSHLKHCRADGAPSQDAKGIEASQGGFDILSHQFTIGVGAQSTWGGGTGANWQDIYARKYTYEKLAARGPGPGSIGEEGPGSFHRLAPETENA